MLNFFRKGYPVQYVTLFSVALLMWAPLLLNSGQNFSVDQPFFTIHYNITGLNAYLINGLLFFVIIVSALVVNVMATANEFTGKLMTMTMFLFLLLIFSFPGFISGSAPMLMVNLLLIFILGNLFKLSETLNPIPLVFDSSLLLGICSFVFFPAVFLLLVIWAALLIHRLNLWRYYVVSLIGLMTPYLFLLTWLFWTGQLTTHPVFFNENRLAVSFVWIEQTSWLEKIIFALIFLLTVISFIRVIMQQAEKSINLRRNLAISEYGLIIIFPVVLFFGRDLSSGILLITPVVLLMSHAFYKIKKTKWLNLLFAVLVLLIVVNRFLSLFL